MLQMNPYEIISPKAAAHFPEKIKELQQKGSVLFESTVVSKDEKHLSIELNLVIINYHGKPAILSTIRDITERKKLEEKYYTLVEKGNDGIVIIQNDILKYINSKMSAMTGYSIKEVIEEPFSRYVSQDYKELVLKRYKKRLKDEQNIPSKYEINIISKEGTKIPVEMNVSLIEYEGLPATMAIIRDITERKKAEKKLKNFNELIKQRLDIEKTLLEVSNIFIVPDDIDKAIDESLEKIGNLCGACRSYIFMIQENGKLMDNTHEWCNNSVTSQKENLQELPTEMFPWWMKKLHKNEIIHINDTSSMPIEAAAEKER